MTSMYRRLIALVAILALALAACGDDADVAGTEDTTTDDTVTDTAATDTGSAEACETPDDVRLQLQWFAQAQFAGYYAAIDRGYYDDRCLNVEILEGGVDIVPQQVLASGGAEFGIAWVPKALVSRQAGADIINVAQMFERSGTLMVSWADSGITAPEDWEGKVVGNWGFGNEYELLAAIEKFDVQNVELVAQDFTMAALLNREIDSAEAMTYNEYAQVLEAENPDTGELYQPEDLSVIDFNEVGTAMLQDALWVNAEWIADNEDIAERFLEASFEGWIYCRDNPDSCVQSVLDAGSTLGLSHQTWMMNEINALIWPASNGIGVMNEELWNQTVEIATTQIPDLQGVEIGEDVYRSDLAESAVAALEEKGLDVHGNDWERIEVQLNPGGE
ncbi:MAG TPA: ABC transporter substrate-binding protein [Acidimicrobiia bacterium]|nr:ABC transporter substrate-binding protein [Acidimicrobiia bacterium]